MAASTGGSSQKVGEKRKRVVLSIEDKLKIIKLIESNVSYTVISERFGIGRSTVCDINRTKDEIRRFSQKMVDMGTKNAKTRKVGEYESVLIQLKDMAAKKRLSSLKQTSITSYM